MWQVTCDMWHVTRDTGRVTSDMWHVGGGWTFSQNFSSLLIYDIMEEKAHGPYKSITDKAVYRTAPATPGLLKTY